MIKVFLNRKLTIKEFVELYTLRNFFCSEPSKFQKTGLKCIAFWRLALASYHFPLYIKRALISSAIPLYRSDIKSLFISFIFLFLYHSFYDRLRIHFYLLHSDFFLLIKACEQLISILNSAAIFHGLLY